MNNSIQIVKNKVSSLEIAELTGKSHAHIMRDIRNMEPAWEKVNQSKFGLVEYVDLKGEKRPCYELTKVECLYISTKFNDEARAKLVLRWEELERNIQKQVPQSFSQALLLAAQQQDQIEKQMKLIGVQNEQIHEMTNAIASMQNKVSYLDRILASRGTVTMTSIAQDYGMSAKHMNNILKSLGIQRKVSGQWILYSDYLDKGYVHSKMFSFTRSDGTPDVTFNTEWTQSGRLFLYEKLKSNNILPLIERN